MRNQGYIRQRGKESWQIKFDAGRDPLTGARGSFTFRTTFFTDGRLGLTLATLFACAAFRALPRLGEVRFGSFPRFCTFDRFLRLAMIDPRSSSPQCIDARL